MSFFIMKNLMAVYCPNNTSAKTGKLSVIKVGSNEYPRSVCSELVALVSDDGFQFV